VVHVHPFFCMTMYKRLNRLSDFAIYGMGIREYLLSESYNAEGCTLFHTCTFHIFCVMSGLHRELDENCTLMGYYAGNNGNLLRKFWDFLKMGLIGFLKCL
jgi:hypothetical protein